MSKTIGNPSQLEEEAQKVLQNWLDASPIPSAERLDNLGLLLKRQLLGRMLFIEDIYRQIVPVHGSIMEFGVRWGQNMALFSTLRGMFEPYNYNRKIIGFDTFEGFPGISTQDGGDPAIAVGNYGVKQGYEQTLSNLLDAHEKLSPIPHIKKYELVKGDVTQTLDAYLKKHPETIVALAYFDFDLYAPTKHALERILPRMPKGSILAFDELNYERFPGETQALLEVLELRKLALKRVPYSSLTSYVTIE